MAQKQIQIDGVDVNYVSNAATPYLYRQEFHRDIIGDLQKIMTEWQNDPSTIDLECIEQIAYIMAKQGGSANTDSIVNWLSQFDGLMSVYQTLPTIMEVWQVNNTTTSKAKKK